MVLEKLTGIYKTIAGIQIALVSVLLQIAWQITNRELPISDGGDHFRISYLIYLAFQEGFVNGVSFLFHTGGKPILFSAFAAPLVYFFQFNELLPVVIFTVLIQSITSIGYFWLFSYKIEAIRSGLLSALITTSPYIFGMHTQFMPEILWHMWFVLFLATLLRSEGLAGNSKTFLSGLFLGFTILARPAESIVLITPMLGVYVLYLHKENRIQIAQLLILVVIASLPIILCSLISAYRWNVSFGLASIALSSVVFIKSSSFRFKPCSEKTTSTMIPLTERHCHTAHIQRFLLPITVLLSIWLLFYAAPIYGWTYDNSFGANAKTNDQVNLSKNIILILYEMFRVYGLPAFGAITSLAVLSCICIEKKPIENRVFKYIFGGVTAALLPMVIAYSVTGTSDPRRIFLAIALLISAMSSYATFGNGKATVAPQIIIIVLVALLTFQSFQILAIVSQNDYLMAGKQYVDELIGIEAYRYPRPSKGEDANVVRAINALGITNARIAVFSLGMFSDHVLYQAESLRYVTLGIDKSLHFGTMWAYVDYESYLDVVSRLQQNGFQYVLLEDIDNPIRDPILKTRLQSHTFFVHEILSLIAKLGASNITGLELIGKFKVGDRDQYVFRVEDPSKPKVSATSQLGEFSPDGLISARQPGWHSSQNPTYPQYIDIDLKTVRTVSSVGFLPQDGYALRGPKSVEISISRDNKEWVISGQSSDICKPTNDGWHDVYIGKQTDIQFIRISIHANCGSPDLLTLRGLRIN